MDERENARMREYRALTRRGGFVRRVRLDLDSGNTVPSRADVLIKRRTGPGRRCRALRRWAWAGLAIAGSCVSVAAMGSGAQIHVEFLADGRCTVTATGEGFHSILTYLPQTSVSPTSELRCAIPPVPKGLAVDLTVTLPRGVAPSSDDSPRLTWTESDHRWIGTASLPAAPSVVRIPESRNQSAFRARLLLWTAVGAACALVGLLTVLGLRRRTRFST